MLIFKSKNNSLFLFHCSLIPKYKDNWHKYQLILLKKFKMSERYIRKSCIVFHLFSKRVEWNRL